jgi:hypothetical protein
MWRRLLVPLRRRRRRSRRQHDVNLGTLHRSRRAGHAHVQRGLGRRTTSAGTVSGGTCSASRTYTAAGVYTVRLTVTDDDHGSGESIFQYVVVYDPSAGFVTGGGWITSPAGAYVANPTLTGRANFGFVSKYLSGATVPSGQTEFQFKAGNLNFHSSLYERLVVGGARAQYPDGDRRPASRRRRCRQVPDQNLGPHAGWWIGLRQQAERAR